MDLEHLEITNQPDIPGARDIFNKKTLRIYLFKQKIMKDRHLMMKLLC